MSLFVKKYVNYFHVHLNDEQNRDLFHKEDIRFFKYDPNFIYNTADANGIIIKLCHWDHYKSFKQSFEIAKKIKHPNILKPICYFEFEDDIIDFCSGTNIQKFENSSIICLPFFESLSCQLSKDILKQIILIYFIMIPFKISDICFFISREEKQKKIKYKIENKLYFVKTKQIVKCDFILDKNTLALEEILDQFKIQHFKSKNIDNILQEIDQMGTGK